jgi:hypothetical protein
MAASPEPKPERGSDADDDVVVVVVVVVVVCRGRVGAEVGAESPAPSTRGRPPLVALLTGALIGALLGGTNGRGRLSLISNKTFSPDFFRRSLSLAPLCSRLVSEV